MAELGKPAGKARETRRGGRKGSPPGRNIRLGKRGDRDTPRSHAADGEDVTRKRPSPGTTKAPAPASDCGA